MRAQLKAESGGRRAASGRSVGRVGVLLQIYKWKLQGVRFYKKALASSYPSLFCLLKRQETTAS